LGFLRGVPLDLGARGRHMPPPSISDILLWCWPGLACGCLYIHPTRSSLCSTILFSSASHSSSGAHIRHLHRCLSTCSGTSRSVPGNLAACWGALSSEPLSPTTVSPGLDQYGCHPKHPSLPLHPNLAHSSPTPNLRSTYFESR
jgi:hypothetical protein